MSNTKREPLLGEASHIDAPCQYNSNQALAWASGHDHARNIYESARAKDAELIQQLANALDGLVEDRGGIIVAMRRSHKALDAAEAAGFKPSHP